MRSPRPSARPSSQLEADIANLRALITDLRPAGVDELGAEAAIEAWPSDSRAKGLAVDVSVELAYERCGASTATPRARDRDLPASSKRR